MPTLLAQAQAHLHAVSAARIGPLPLWPAEIDTGTQSLLPAGVPSRFPPRCYRWIAAPRGANLYWDLPQVVAAHRVAALTGDTALATAADAYVGAWLTHATAPCGLLRWGNHYYWDLDRGAVAHFASAEDPHPPAAHDDAQYHEMRPLPTPWAALARVDAAATDRALDACRRHIVGPDGSFDRHATVTPVVRNQHAFLESGAILAEGWAQRAAQGGADPLAAAARSIITFSASQRGRSGLLRNSPTLDRWDMHTATSEVGMWAGAVARCGDLLGDRTLIACAAEVLARWLELAWDPARQRFFGRLHVDSGLPVLGARTTQYQPGDWCDVWEPLFPAHDYPLPCAEACLDVYHLTGDDRFAIGAQRWLRHIVGQGLPQQATVAGNRIPGTCAEHYGRAIHVLDRIGSLLHDPLATLHADRLAAEAVKRLWTGTMFRGRPGEDRYAAVDGVGILLLALLEREHGPGDLLGFTF